MIACQSEPPWQSHGRVAIEELRHAARAVDPLVGMDGLPAPRYDLIARSSYLLDDARPLGLNNQFVPQARTNQGIR